MYKVTTRHSPESVPSVSIPQILQLRIPVGFTISVLHVVLLSLILASYPAHTNLLHFTILTILGSLYITQFLATEYPKLCPHLILLSSQYFPEHTVLKNMYFTVSPYSNKSRFTALQIQNKWQNISKFFTLAVLQWVMQAFAVVPSGTWVLKCLSTTRNNLQIYVCV
jgi:hypothetical protein